MRVVLIQPDSPYLSFPLAFPSLGLLYISSYLKAHGYEPELYDLTGGGELPKIKADIVAFTCQITQWHSVKEMKRKIKAKRFIIGGPFPTHSPEVCESEGFEVVQGEGENAMLRLLGHGIDGYVDPNFFPDWPAIDLNRYGYGLEGKRCINIMTKRGNCPYRCTFCAKQEQGRSPLRFRTAQNVLDEVDWLRSMDFEAVAIYDDDVLINKQRDYKIFQGLKERNMPYRCMTRTNLATKADLQFLKETGCAELAIGVESADPHIHNVVCQKGTTIEQDTSFVRACKFYGLRVKTYLIFGLPGESADSIQRTIDWLASEKPDNFDISIFTPYPGSDIYKNRGKYDIAWNQEELEAIWYSGEAQYGQCAVSTSHLTAQQILQAKEYASILRGIGGSTSYWRPI